MAGVSPTTVVNVLHGRVHKMKGETLDRVRRIIKETKYVPNMGGRLLGNYGSRIIGVIISYEKRDTVNIAQGPFFSEIIGRLEYHIRQNGYFMMLYTAANVEESAQMARAWNVEGLIVLGCHMEECSRFLESTSVPLVFIDSYFLDDNLPYTCIGLEDRKGGYLMTKHLIGRGHRRICFLTTGSLYRGVFYERYLGCRQAMEEHKLPFGRNDYAAVPADAGRQNYFLRNFINTKIRKYTALFFAFDLLALRAMSALRDNGIKIPADISVCGFDGDTFSSLYRPSLTTVRQDVAEKAAQAIAMLMKLIKKESIDRRIIRLDVSLCKGESVKSIR